MSEIDEAELRGGGQRGAVLDGGADGRNRIVQAAVLRRCCHELKDQIDARGLRLTNAIVTGGLDLTGLIVPFPLRFDGCEFDTAPLVEGAQLFELALTGSPYLPGLLGNGLRVCRDLNLSHSRVAGTNWTNASTSKASAIWLCEAQIGGRLLFVGATLDGQGHRAIHADRAEVAGAVRLMDGFSSSGEIRLHGARIGSSLDLNGAKIASSNGSAIDLENATIDGSVFLIEDQSGRHPDIHGRITMASAHISARLLVRNVTIKASADE